MAEIDNEQAKFNARICARVKQLRENKGWTSGQMAIALGVEPDRYRKWEYRTPIPHYYLERFALIVDREIEFILTGKIAPRIDHIAEKRRKAG